MRSFYRLAVLALPLLGRGACEEPASPTKQTENNVQAFYANANEAFQDLLNALPEESLHAALNSLTHFRDGIFESDRDGVERVHQDNPPLATKLIVAAVQDLKAKRQVPSNGTTTSTGQPPESTTASPPSSPAVVVPVPVETTTDSSGQTTTVSSSILSEPTASVALTTTLTNAQGSVQVATTTKPAVIFSTTDSSGRGTVITSAVDFQPTSGEVLTRTNEQGSTFLTTYTPDGGKVSSVVLLTTTGSDGQPSVVTSYTYVDPAAATGSGAGGATTTGARPGLQSGAAVRNRAVDAAMYGGAL
ncbi:hypothetical protein K458DRAFT_244430, partial [Lentithecium fluviatile CBS 122367]